jgi:hypothetical protein
MMSRFQDHIDAHKTGKFGYVADIGLPWEKCINDDEVIQYLNYCFEVIELNQNKINGYSIFSSDDCSEICELMNEIMGAHGRISTCHKLLNNKLSKVMSDYINNLRSKTIIYTARKF